ncbi:MAG TPA: triose-phosphate isomerase, partial [Verrucomicrobiae bacterium]|nr:triose-phosphate isomerase [Verrucomicrobiae bacterium]
IPILCVGEKLEHRETGVTNKVIEAQLNGALQSMDSADIGRLVIAYEPVWAIGTGKTASSKDAEEVCEFIRNHISALAGSEIAQAIRIQYGGSVKPAGANELMSMPNIDGALVGGASLEPESFAQIVKYPG